MTGTVLTQSSSLSSSSIFRSLRASLEGFVQRAYQVRQEFLAGVVLTLVEHRVSAMHRLRVRPVHTV